MVQSNRLPPYVVEETPIYVLGCYCMTLKSNVGRYDASNMDEIATLRHIFHFYRR